MKFSRRALLKLLSTSGLIYSCNSVCATTHISGEWRLVDKNTQVSGILELTPFDVISKVSEKYVFGDGHGHKVKISREAWLQILKKEKIVIRSGLDSEEGKHSHWIIVKI